MAAGFDDTQIRRNAYLNRIANTIQDYTIFANRYKFPQFNPANSPGGNAITWLIDYTTTNNGGIMSTPYDAAPDPDDLARVTAYQNKDYFQHAAQIYDIIVNQIETNRDGSHVPSAPSMMTTAIENSAKLMGADMASAAVTDLIAMIDSAGNFSDAALLRSTYNLASAEATSVGTLALSDIDGVVDSLKTKEYGRAKRDDLAILCDSTNHRRIANLSSGAQYREFNASSDNTSAIDGGFAHRIFSYDGIEIWEEDSMPSTDILIIRKGTVQFYDHWMPAIKDLNVHAWTEKKLMGMGSNVLVTNPRWNGKLSGITG